MFQFHSPLPSKPLKNQRAPLWPEYRMELGDTSITVPLSQITTRPEFELALIPHENSQPCQGS